MASKKTKVVYSPDYDITFYGIEKQHPFDSCKYSHAWQVVEAQLGSATLQTHHIPVTQPISREALLRVHSAGYLDSLQSSKVVAQALEMPMLAFLPAFALDKHILTPMRLATQGTVLATEAVLSGGCDLAINLSGGYHHASRERGEGFSVYSDVFVAIEAVRAAKRLDREEDRILYIDVDAHQGNGIERLAVNDPSVAILDIYNEAIYPRDHEAKEAIRYDLPLPSGTGDTMYLDALAYGLTAALEDDTYRMAFYNAGTDPFAGDTLGRLNLTADGILRRDRYVLDTLAAHNIPCVLVLSGGYSKDSYQLVANTVLDRLV